LTYLTGQQVIILKEGTERSRDRDARRSNMMAAQIISEVLKTTLGPRGMDKMLIDSLGDISITSDGATILNEIDVQHPAAKMLIEVAKTQDDEVGDGTTTAVLLAGELLKKAGDPQAGWPVDADELEALLPIGGDVVTIFHSDIEDTTKAIPIVKSKWAGPIAVYPEAGRRDYVYNLADPRETNKYSIEEWVQFARNWVSEGVQIIGGCCGIGVEYIEALRGKL